MKTLGRTLIILAAFALVMGITYVLVKAGTTGNSSNPPALGRGGDGFARPAGLQPGFQNSERPEFPGGERGEFRGERGGGWMFGALKNIGIVGIIVVLIVLPKGWLQKRKRAAQFAGG